MNGITALTQVLCWDIDLKKNIFLKCEKQPETDEIVQFTIKNDALECVGDAKASFKEKSQTVEINLMKNKEPQKYRRIGAALDQKIMEERMRKGYKGGVLLLAVGNSHLFHWNMGFRVIPTEDKKMAGIMNFTFCDIQKELKGKTFEELRETYKDGKKKKLNELINLISEKAREFRKSENDIIENRVQYFPQFCYTMSGQIKTLMEEAQDTGTEPRRSSLGYVSMFMPLKSIRIWNKIIEANDDRARCAKLFAKLKRVPQPE